MIKDRESAKNMGPGKYETQKLAATQKPTSWNFGKIPFMGGDKRFKKDYKDL